MANWSNPVLSSTYTAVLDDLKNRDIDAAVMFSPSYSTATNIATGTVRWNPTNGYFEIYSGTAWSALISKYLIDVDKLDGQDGSYYLNWNNLTNKPTTFAPSTHTHDDRYYTESESDARFANKLVVSGSTIKLQTFGNVDLATITVPYATSAGNAGTAGGYSVGQNLLTTSAVTFASLTTTGSAAVEGTLTIGNSGDLTSGLEVWDNSGGVYRTLRWTSSITEWQVEDSTGTLRRIYHEGHVPDWSEISGKPTTFAPSSHGHSFDATNKGVLYTRTSTQMATYTGSVGELVYNSTTGRLHTHNGQIAGGYPLALLSDVPASPDLSPYALLASNTFTGGQTMPTARLTTTTGLSLTSTAHAFQIGSSSGVNMAIDNNNVQVRNNNAAGKLSINTLGGDVAIGDDNSLITMKGYITGSLLATVAEARDGTAGGKLMSPNLVREAILVLPRLKPLLAINPSNVNAYLITDLPIDATIHFYFSQLKCSSTSTSNFLRFRTSSDNGTTWNAAGRYNFTDNQNWNTTGVYGRLTLHKRKNPISGLTMGFSYMTGGNTLSVAMNSGEFPDDTTVTSTTNAVEFSWTTGNFATTGKIFVFAEYEA